MDRRLQVAPGIPSHQSCSLAKTTASPLAAWASLGVAFLIAVSSSIAALLWQHTLPGVNFFPACPFRYKLKKDPVEVLERDPDLIRRAQECDVPFEPVYENQDGSFQAPQLNYAEKRTEWQAYIDRTFYGQK
eukprot:365844-Chlamydomonas_euryale.AAC.5